MNCVFSNCGTKMPKGEVTSSRRSSLLGTEAGPRARCSSCPEYGPSRRPSSLPIIIGKSNQITAFHVTLVKMDTSMMHINIIWWEIANTIRPSHFISTGVTTHTEEQLTRATAESERKPGAQAQGQLFNFLISRLFYTAPHHPLHLVSAWSPKKALHQPFVNIAWIHCEMSPHLKS